MGLCSGCSLLTYAPGPHQVALLEEPGDTRGTVRVGTGLYGGAGLETAMQIIHAPVDHLLVHAALHGAVRERHRQWLAEAGLGFFADMSQRLSFEVLGAYGRGSFWAQDEENLFEYTAITTLNGSYERVYGQINLGLRTVFHPPRVGGAAPGIMGVGFRFARVRGYGFEWSRLDTPERLRQSYAEPVVFARLGEGPVQLEWQVGLSIPVGGYEPDYDWQWLSGSLGLTVVLNELFE